ncbi:MAG: cyclase family protein [Acidobacteria bacterium]|nr:cyclase family protein [Acidobacteriota bacterium]MDA1233601.1 cyclase family protein [Acidobacteriota bacterium]
MPNCKLCVLVAVLALAGCTEVPAPQSTDPFAGMQWIDLTHAYDAETIFWPTGKPFEHVQTSWGEAEGGYFYSAYDFAVSEHAGTHLDAPIHFSAGGATIDNIPLDNLIGPAVVIDVVAQAAADRDYLASVEDLSKYEAEYGPITADDVVLIRTGWSARWPNTLEYMGDDRPGRADELHFPGIAPELAEVLAQRGVKAVGIDTASIDYGASKDFQTHQILMGAGVTGLENLVGLDALPARGSWVVALPMKIGAGSGAPARIAALVRR